MSNKVVKKPVQQNNTEELIINTGAKKYEVKDEYRRPMGYFYWNPTDTGILNRYDEFVKSLNDLEPQDGQDNEAFIKEADKTLVEKMSYMLNEDATSLFGKVTPLTMLANGDVYVLEVLNIIGRLIEKETGQRVARANRKVNKYTQKYHN